MTPHDIFDTFAARITKMAARRFKPCGVLGSDDIHQIALTCLWELANTPDGEIFATISPNKLVAIVRCKTIDAIRVVVGRKGTKRQTQNQGKCKSLLLDEPALARQDRHQNVTDAMIDAKAILRQIDKLDHNIALAVKLKWLDGKTQQQIQSKTRLSPNQVKQILDKGFTAMMEITHIEVELIISALLTGKELARLQQQLKRAKTPRVIELLREEINRVEALFRVKAKIALEHLAKKSAKKPTVGKVNSGQVH